MPTRNVVLTDMQAKFVEQMVCSGHYQYGSEVLRGGLRLVQARAAEQAVKLAALHAAVLETDGRNGTGTGRCDRVSRPATCCH